jgi:hypothetical protein
MEGVMKVKREAEAFFNEHWVNSSDKYIAYFKGADGDDVHCYGSSPEDAIQELLDIYGDE